MKTLGREITLTPEDAPAPDANSYVEIASVTRAVHRIEFPETQRGMAGYLVIWYENAKAERGPKSDPLEFIII